MAKPCRKCEYNDFNLTSDVCKLCKGDSDLAFERWLRAPAKSTPDLWVQQRIKTKYAYRGGMP